MRPVRYAPRARPQAVSSRLADAFPCGGARFRGLVPPMRLALPPAFLAVVLISGCNCGPPLSNARPEIQVLPASLDFGSRVSGSVTTRTVAVTNTGVAALTLSRLTLDGDLRSAFSLGSAPTTVQPGATISLSVSYTAPLAEGPDGASLLIESDAQAAPEVRVSLAGRAVYETADAGPPDAGPPDAGPPDAGPPDAGPPPADGGCWPPLSSGTSSVAYQIDIAHTGAQPTDLLRLPLCRRWRRDLGGAAGYPVVAGGRVFVATHTNQSGYGNLLWALDQATGAVLWGPVDLGGTYWWAAVAYDAGRVFAVNASGLLRAVDASTGAVLWTLQVPGQYACDSAPTATGGMVYIGAAGSGGTVYGLWAGDGGVRWTMPVANGNTSSPAVSASGVYVSYACNQAYGFSPASGAQLWHHAGPCSGGGGKNVSVYRGRVYTRDSFGDLVLDATSGAQVGSYSSHFIPAFSNDLAIVTPGWSLAALSLADGGRAWTFDAGGESISTAPIVVGPHVIAASGAHLFAVNVSDGTLASSAAVTGVLGPDEQNVSSPLAGFAAADGMLFVPVGTAIEAY